MINEVRTIFETFPDRIFTISDLSERVGSPEPGIRADVSQLYKTGFVERVSRGHYRFIRYGTLDKSDLITSPIGLHRILLRKNIALGEIYPPLVAISKHPSQRIGNMDCYELDLSGVSVRVNVSDKSISIMVSCNKSDLHKYLLPSELLLIFDFIKDKFGIDFDTEPDKWDLLTFDMNRDIPGYRIDGCSALTYQHVKGLLYKAYNKGSALRVEASCSLPVKFNEIATWLKAGPVPGISEMIEEIQGMKEQIKAITGRSPNKKKTPFEKYLSVFENLIADNNETFTLSQLDNAIMVTLDITTKRTITRHQKLMKQFLEENVFVNQGRAGYKQTYYWNRPRFYKFYKVEHPIYNDGKDVDTVTEIEHIEPKNTAINDIYANMDRPRTDEERAESRRIKEAMNKSRK